MPRYRKQSQVRLSPEHKELLVKLAQSTKFDQKTIMGILIDLAVEHDFMVSGYEDRIKEADKKRTGVTLRKKTDCPALRELDEVWKCVWGRDGKTPDIKKLAPDYSDALDACEGCTITLKIKMREESYQEQIRVLEYKLQTRQTDKYKVPVCQQGATLSIDCLEFTGCPKNQGKAVSIKEYCQKLNQGQGCAVYVERVLGVGEKV